MRTGPGSTRTPPFFIVDGFERQPHVSHLSGVETPVFERIFELGWHDKACGHICHKLHRPISGNVGLEIATLHVAFAQLGKKEVGQTWKEL